MRRALRRSLQGVPADARAHPGHRSPAAGPIRRDRVVRASDGFEVLIYRLLAPGPASVHGIAQVRLLLTDGNGPLYHAAAIDDLRWQVQRAVDALDPFGEM